jgi:hypothetical protein
MPLVVSPPPPPPVEVPAETFACIEDAGCLVEGSGLQCAADAGCEPLPTRVQCKAVGECTYCLVQPDCGEVACEPVPTTTLEPADCDPRADGTFL